MDNSISEFSQLQNANFFDKNLKTASNGEFFTLKDQNWRIFSTNLIFRREIVPEFRLGINVPIPTKGLSA